MVVLCSKASDISGSFWVAVGWTYGWLVDQDDASLLRHKLNVKHYYDQALTPLGPTVRRIMVGTPDTTRSAHSHRKEQTHFVITYILHTPKMLYLKV